MPSPAPCSFEVLGAIAGLAIAALLVLPAWAARPPSETETGVDSVRFDSESITLTVTDSTARVSGRYRFRSFSPGARRVSLVYPFPVDALHSYPHSIRVYTVLESDSVDVETRKLGQLAGIWVFVPLRPDTITTWHVEYEQRIAAPCARYVLTSTRAWGRPLREARYELVHPTKFLAVEVWPEPDTVLADSVWTIRRCYRQNFMPEGDLQIRWRDPHRPGCFPP